LNRLARRQDGSPAAASTVARKRATLHSVLQYAVELELFPSNPLKRVQWKAPQPTDAVDRRLVVNPTQARALLAAVQQADPAVAAFFACLYYAGLRPAEARNLRAEDCTLPETGWGTILLTGSHQTSGSAWTDSATSGEDRGLKHRGRQDTRLIPVHPDLAASLRRHIATFPLGTDGRLFVTRTGRAGVPIAPPYQHAVSMGTIYRAWHRARETALTEGQVHSLLARRPYDLRHACLSTWLNAGVPPARVAEWAGHGVEVLLRVYAKCVDGDDEAALRRIEQALG
jgi:integrase